MRFAVLGCFSVFLCSASAAQADVLADCNQVRDPQLRLRACSEIIGGSMNPLDLRVHLLSCPLLRFGQCSFGYFPRRLSFRELTSGFLKGFFCGLLGGFHLSELFFCLFDSYLKR